MLLARLLVHQLVSPNVWTLTCIQHSQEKILQQIKKRTKLYQSDSKDSIVSCCKQPNRLQDCSCKNKKGWRHQIHPETSSQLREGIMINQVQK